MAAGLSGKAVAVTTAGFVLLWSGVKGATVGQTLRDLLKGKPVPVTPETPPTVGVSGSGTSASASGQPGTTDSAIANDALKYQGHCYSFGGAPGLDGKSCWDCSSFVNWVLGHDLGLAIPGFKTYNGSEHGPATTSYLIWSGGQHIPHSQLQAGDLVVGFSHMGIATDSQNYISAHDPAERTTVTPISRHFPDPTWSAIRVRVASTTAGQPGPQPGKTQLAGF